MLRSYLVRFMVPNLRSIFWTDRVIFSSFSNKSKASILSLLSVIFLSSLFSPSYSQAFLLKRPTLESLSQLYKTKYLDFYSYFSYQCEQRIKENVGPGIFHDNCLISELMGLYIENSLVLEGVGSNPGVLNEDYIVRSNWTTVDLVSGFFNETFSWSDNELGIKPIINKLVLEVAIRKELEKFKDYLDANANPDLYPLKRYFYPEMMAHFGGFSVIARADAYRQAMSCDFIRTCPVDEPNCSYGVQCPIDNPNCGTEIQKECKTADQALAYLVSREARELPSVTEGIVSDIKKLSQNPAYTGSQVIFDSIENSQALYGPIGNRMSGQEILNWVKNEDACDSKTETNLIDLLCTKIDDSLAFPKNIRDKVLADAMVSAFILWEAQNIMLTAPVDLVMPERVDDYTGLREFLESTEFDMGQEFKNAFEGIRDHFIDYDPSKLIEQVPANQKLSTGS